MGDNVDDNGSDLTSAKERPKSSISTLEPFSPSGRKNRKTGKAGENVKILHLVNIPLECNYESLCTSVSTFGSIREIRMKFMEVNDQWEACVTFSCYEEALRAKINIKTLSVCGKVVGEDLTDRLPQNLDVYRPVEWVKQPSPHQETSCYGERPPAPPLWLVAGQKRRNLISLSSVGTSRRMWEAYVVGTFQGLVRLQSLSTPNLKLSPVCSLS